MTMNHAGSIRLLAPPERWRLASGVGMLSLAVLATTPAHAHPGHPDGGLVAGLAHPLTGWDHLLAMFAVGLWAALRGGRAVWAWPAAFLAAMTFGALAGLMGAQLPLAEPLVLASLIVLGGALAIAVRAPILVGVATTALFGVAHGYAHGAEAPVHGVGTYMIGFLTMTLALQLTGLAAGRQLATLDRVGLARIAGLGIAASGLALSLA